MHGDRWRGDRPLVTGTIADAASIATALIVPVLCYGVIAAFGMFASRPTTAAVAA